LDIHVHDQEGLLRLDAKQLTRGELMIEPIEPSILQIREWIMARSARQLVSQTRSASSRRLLPAGSVLGRLPCPVPGCIVWPPYPHAEMPRESDDLGP